jgi:putative ATP-binding cassette transporter
VFAAIASIAAGLLTIAIMIVVFRLVGENKEIRLELFVALCIGAVVCQILSRAIIGSIGRRAVLSLRVELFRRIMAAPLADIERIGPSRLAMTFTEDIGRIAAIVPNLVVLCTNITLIIAFLIYLGWLSVAKLEVILLAIAVGAGCHFILRREATRQVRISREKRGDLLESFRSALSAVKELKLHSGRREKILETFVTRARDLQRSIDRQSKLFGGSAAVAQALFFTTLGLVMFGYVGGSTDPRLIVSFGVGIIYLMRPLQRSIGIVQALVAADIALDRVEELGFTLQAAATWNRNVRVKSEVVRCSPIAEFEKLELFGVVHSYAAGAENVDAQFVLGPVDLSLTRGDLLFVVGGNGSGKTTFAKVLTGLYQPTAGVIRVNGHVVSAEDLEWYSGLFSAVFHDFFVFDQSLNGNEWSDDLLCRFKIYSKVQIEDDKLLNASELSIGERKRLALMLACADDRPIIILDEWAADQDPDFKEMFYKEILSDLKMRGKLVIVISHDDQYFNLADKMLFIQKGMPVFRQAIENSI